MHTQSVKLYSPGFGEARTYLAAGAFILGNLIFPRLCHAFEGGGPTWLPIYFFTLVGAYKYGWRTGLLTALLSPLINAGLFGMPAVHSLPAILLKSVLLAGIAGFVAARTRRANLLTLAVVVLGYQSLGTLGEWILKGDLFLAAQDFRIGIPGMILQIVGGWLAIRYIPLQRD
ncbi:MAG TPA: ECF transporter S component [Candidatus Alistipes intestinigallinarum]|uniref:ECF transporter S component n=1 Tax=Candidatus Alistipes intestinigallinarum TaxID=2838440 RepID=A0A9D1YZ78_9BACT|nr:ECF transporter S component [Candidatus Alistipes intestinigallinarum]